MNGFAKQIGALVGIVAILIGAGWAIAGQVFMTRTEYLQAKADTDKQQAVTNQRLETVTEQLDKRLTETNTHLANLNTVLKRIKITGRRRD